MAASSREAVKRAVQQVRPILSINRDEARKRALNLYKAWYRQIPYIVMDYDIPKSVPQCREKLREEFEKHRNVTDIRVIDMLVIKVSPFVNKS
ncbi:NADH dehydrogenase [ubiquinone] 1 alpha subcomplex subunit 6-like [Teleopsis dalmanni]|uniref:NADH dehydrogenase [ubiquinone] 1 alpha subcomplex subunit 6-like n=1 Tax=Teleopsis dalmanni TaxID=139649 RepID=UPI0018CE3D1F|nr:NADH dehydrogenase [ubiquinone] 1 alpha subcomplex subunit 6-like [Teleopsis dalmanni]